MFLHYANRSTRARTNDAPIASALILLVAVLHNWLFCTIFKVN